LEVDCVEVLVEDLKFVGHWHLGLTEQDFCMAKADGLEQTLVEDPG
jgi:hypothetical protein